MSQSSLNQAIEMAKIVLQSKPESLVLDARYPTDSAENVAVFIEKLATALDKISNNHNRTAK